MQCCSSWKPNLHCFVKEFLVLLAVLSYGKTFCQVISKSNSVYEFFVYCHIMKLLIIKRMRNVKYLRWNLIDGVTSGQKPSTKIIYIVLQTSVGLF